MVSARAMCINADCHHDLSSSSQVANLCPGCGAPVITACLRCSSPLAEMKGRWAKLCEKCGQELRHHLKQSYFGVM